MDAAWSPDVSVTVNGRTRKLGSEQRIQVSPGTTRLTFVYSDAEGLRYTQTSQVRVAEGASERVAVPFGAPGVLQVQPRLNSPPGIVFVDGEQMSGRIVRERKRPGSYKVRVEPAGAAGGAAVERDLEVPAGKKLVATYDLAAGKIDEKVSSIEPGG